MSPVASSASFQEKSIGSFVELGPYEVSKDEIVGFATQFDPAPFHLDEEAASNSMLGGLSASGWHTCSILMRMMCDAYILVSGSLGSPGIDYCKWLNPVFAGDVLTGKSILLSRRNSGSRPDVGIAEFRHELFNQRGQQILELGNVGFFRMKTTESDEDLSQGNCDG